MCNYRSNGNYNDSGHVTLIRPDKQPLQFNLGGSDVSFYGQIVGTNQIKITSYNPTDILIIGAKINVS